MKIKLFFLLFLVSKSLFAQIGSSSGHNPHDSLLFDDTNEILPDKNGEKKCKWRVKHVWGKVRGTKDTTIIITHACGIPIDPKKEGIKSFKKDIRSWLKDGDELYDKDTLTMDDNSFVQIERTVEYGVPEMKVGTFIITAKCKNFTVPDCKCEVNTYETVADKIFNTIVGNSFVFSGIDFLCPLETYMCIIKNNGTMYALDFNDNEEVIRVYEGSVEVIPKKFEISAMDEMGKLSEDYQKGNISLEEFTKKAKELSSKVKDESIRVSKKNIVEAGFQVTVSDFKIGDIVPISSDVVKWWEVENPDK